jgi:uncharacterized protein YabE (DUF348 family)
MTFKHDTWKAEGRIAQRARRRYARGFLAAPVFFVLAALLFVGYQRTSIRVRLVADDYERDIRTHQTTVEALLREAGLTVYPEDVVEPGLSERLVSNATISVHRARPVVVEVDGQTINARTQETTTGKILTALDVNVSQHDEVRTFSEMIADEAQDSAIHIQIKRAVPITVKEVGSPPTHLYSTASTVGEALHAAGIILYLADDVSPSQSSAVEPGIHISINRSVPVTILADGHTLRTRTRRSAAGDVLADAGISLHGLDFSEPDLDSPVEEGMEIQVVRVREQVLVQQETIPFETQWGPDPELELDHQRVGQDGQLGVFERRIRVRYEDGQEVNRQADAEWVAKPPQPRIYNYGTKIVLRTIDTPSGPVEYWRKFRMLATSYNAASAGKSPEHPRYGITRLGWKMRFGIVAVDPRLIRLGSKVYVPGYGIGDAADTGGAIRNLRIDLGYDDDNLVSWYRCVDVYLLAPVPDQVEYVMSSLVHPWCR